MGKSAQVIQQDVRDMTHNLYALADAMGCSLFESSQYKDEWYGGKPRQVQSGPWSLHLSNAGWSDQLSKAGCSMLVKMKGNLWAYIISENCHLKLVLFDGKAAGLTRENAPAWGSRNIDVTMEGIKDHAKAWFKHTHQKGWEQVKEEEF